MEALWNLGPTSIREIQEAFPSEGPARLHDDSDDRVPHGRKEGGAPREEDQQCAHLRSERCRGMMSSAKLIDELLGFFGGRIQPVMAHLVESGKITLDDVHEAEQALRKARRKDRPMLSALHATGWNDLEWGWPTISGNPRFSWSSVGALTLLFRRNSAVVRYRLWLIASAKFLIPFSFLVGIGGLLQLASGPAVHTNGSAGCGPANQSAICSTAGLRIRFHARPQLRQ